MLQNVPVVLILLAGIMFSLKARKLTLAGALVGGLIGGIVFIGAGYTGIAMMAAFFLVSVLATSWKRKIKEAIGAAERQGGRRKAGQVIANAGVAGICALLILLYPAHTSLFQTALAASFSSATADTLSSELGTVYGSRFFNVLSFKKDRRGLDGVISMEGVLIGIAGSLIIAIIYAAGYGWSNQFWWIIIAGTIGNLSDSILGATLERRYVLNNNAVNFFNTLIAAVVAALLFLFL